jgi:hypothetical protein
MTFIRILNLNKIVLPIKKKIDSQGLGTESMLNKYLLID